MKNIYSFPVLVIIIFLFFSVNPVFSREQTDTDYGFSLAPQFGFISGKALELVYPDQSRPHIDLLSELTWEMKPVYYLGIQIDIKRNDIMSATGFFSSISFKMGIPGVSGIHENRDWMNLHNNNLTHFSSHTNNTKQFFWLDAVFGISIPAGNFYLKPFISGSWMRFSFSGTDGYGNYTWFTPPDVSYSGQEVIRYQQDWFILAIGFSAGTKILSSFSVDLTFQISPFTYCAARDDHLPVILPPPFSNTNHKIFKDYTSLGLFLEPSAAISFSAGRFDFSLIGAYRYIGKTRGTSYLDNNNTGYFSKIGNAGASLSFFDIRFLAGIKIWQNLKN
ncbi:MAG: omptin family outer membrane protease [Treponema sp.]|nr:omptin family outer membrane protease [Treponema sp.]